MAEKSKVVIKNIAGDSTEVEAFPAIGDGEIWTISSFGAFDINNGDNKSSAYLLKFGTKIIRPIALSGNTFEIKTEFEIVGNGTDQVTVTMQNKSSYPKTLGFWIEAHSLE